MPHRHNPEQNRLLAALHPHELQELLPHLQVVHLKAGEQLAESGERLSHVYFPIDSAISLFYRLENGGSAGVAVIGNEGMFSVAQVLGGAGIPYWATVETSGHVFQVAADRLCEMSKNLTTLCDILLLYAQASLTQIAQTVVCEKHHSLRQQLCQHLLLINDKSLSDDFRLTHEAIANMLGVRRESITEEAGELREQGLIDYNRGHVKVLNRAGLEKQCCECYSVVRDEFTRLLGNER
ncbi:Crp/Fnr family transcriptional regulator [Sideroxydans lithotrophicus]|uniref:Transcriptional regulator, Crp/Fnr family n=1 Tax=Sideroxydans lithotrophicus (strain ES-1) TaxID=580332 RepID=D5CN94_SIDLE|nr:Crp/Fnr family transcriptional regulator [Sideroxydans lithotrophicus]ADE12791.1 transcriptional regulator, Crp/Fnr family [Sideroxydans lithotrophicus ES-1]